MRVVSQKKDASYDFDRTEFRTNYECISATFDGRTFAIGKYATPERAAEVFMDMHKAYEKPVVFYSSISNKLSEALIKEFGVDNSTNFVQIVEDKGKLPLSVGSLVWKRSDVRS